MSSEQYALLLVCRLPPCHQMWLRPASGSATGRRRRSGSTACASRHTAPSSSQCIRHMSTQTALGLSFPYTLLALWPAGPLQCCLLCRVRHNSGYTPGACTTAQTKALLLSLHAYLAALMKERTRRAKGWAASKEARTHTLHQCSRHQAQTGVHTVLCNAGGCQEPPQLVPRMGAARPPGRHPARRLRVSPHPSQHPTQPTQPWPQK